MLSWGLSDFKAIVSARLQMHQKRLTVVTGTNSSGKSSILQSLLLLAQTAAGSGEINLNGRLVRLGAPEDVLRKGQHSMQLEFEFDAFETADGSDENLKVNYSLAPELGKLRVDGVSITSSTGLVIFEATKARMNRIDAIQIADQLNDGSITLLRVTTEGNRQAPNRMYVMFRGLVPVGYALKRSSDWIEKSFKTYVESANIQTQAVQENLSRWRYFVVVELSHLVNKRQFLIEQAALKPQANPQPVFSQRWSLKDWREMSSNRREALVAQAAAQRSKSPWVFVAISNPKIGRGEVGLQGLVENLVATEHELTSHVLGVIAEEIDGVGAEIAYLGPLRDEPRVVHSAWDERTESLPVGIRGELTAEVLTRMKDSFVLYTDERGERKSKKLPEAVGYWCEYLGIGDAIEVIDHGKLGRGVQLRVDGVHRDLTTIGVGASQLLPVLVAALAVDRDSILLIEQPELHLHPAVQSRLADFFLFARPDIKLVVETHSEYLVTRLRRRVAESKAESSSISLLFVEQAEGMSVIRDLAIDQYGDLSDWPKGFFDAQDNDSLAILRAVRHTLSGAESN